jgi:hypothetical protein
MFAQSNFLGARFGDREDGRGARAEEKVFRRECAHGSRVQTGLEELKNGIRISGARDDGREQK